MHCRKRGILPYITYGWQIGRYQNFTPKVDGTTKVTTAIIVSFIDLKY